VLTSLNFHHSHDKKLIKSCVGGSVQDCCTTVGLLWENCVWRRLKWVNDLEGRKLMLMGIGWNYKPRALSDSCLNIISHAVNSCYISPGMGVGKAFRLQSDLQGHSMILILLPFDRPCNFLSRFYWDYVSILYCFLDIISYFLKLKLRSRNPERISLEESL